MDLLNNTEVIDSAFEKIVDNQKTKKLKIHFLFALNLSIINNESLCRSIVLKAMKKYKIRSVMATVICMEKNLLITTEDIEDRCVGRTFNDDLESAFDDLRFGKKPDEFADTYFLPKLTHQELKLVERKDLRYMKSFSYGENADVPEAKMKLSESDSKFVYAFGIRETFSIKLPLLQRISTRCCFQ